MSRYFSWSRFWAVLMKEFVQMRRDRLTFAMMVGIPILQLILFGFAINSDPRALPTAVLSVDNSEFSRSFLRAVENRVPVVMASNTGPSQIVDAYGRIAGAAHADFTPGIAVARVPYASVPDPAGASLHRFIHAAARLPLSVGPPLRRTRLDQRSA